DLLSTQCRWVAVLTQLRHNRIRQFQDLWLHGLDAVVHVRLQRQQLLADFKHQADPGYWYPVPLVTGRTSGPHDAEGAANVAGFVPDGTIVRIVRGKNSLDLGRHSSAMAGRTEAACRDGLHVADFAVLPPQKEFPWRFGLIFFLEITQDFHLPIGRKVSGVPDAQAGPRHLGSRATRKLRGDLRRDLLAHVDSADRTSF